MPCFEAPVTFMGLGAAVVSDNTSKDHTPRTTTVECVLCMSHLDSPTCSCVVIVTASITNLSLVVTVDKSIYLTSHVTRLFDDVTRPTIDNLR